MPERDDSKIDGRYLKEISAIPVLTRQEVSELFEKIEQGDNSARNKLIKANLRFVKEVSLKFKDTGTPVSDLISEGNMGLAYAIKKFDRTKGFVFLTYAGHWIKKYIRKAIARGKAITGIPDEKLALLKKLERAEEHLEGDLGRKPNLEQLAEFLGVSEMEILKLKDIRYKPVSYEEVQEFNKTDNADYSLLKEEELKILQYRLSLLSSKQRKVIDLYFGLEDGEALNLEQIASQLNISPERARQLREAGLKNLRKAFV
jgi:RNA polymerase primary sigma factor